MAASITVHLQIFKRKQLLRFWTDLDETGIKIHGLLRSYIYNKVITRVAVPFKFPEGNDLTKVINGYKRLGFPTCGDEIESTNI